MPIIQSRSKIWNSLSQDGVDATSVNAFKGRLERRRRHQMDFFKDVYSTI